MSLGHQISRALRTGCLVVWVTVLVAGIASYIAYPSAFTPENIAEFMHRFGGWIWFVYILMSTFRGFTLLPSTPLVIAGTLLFPERPLVVLLVCLIGIGASSTMIYLFSDRLGFHEYFEKHKPQLTHNIRAKLEHPLGMMFVALWAFFPLVPTDLVCYVAGTTEMNYWKFISAIIAGEAILCSVYIFFGGSLVQYFR